MARKCEEFIKGLSDYIDGDIEPELCDEIEKHIGQCNNCRIMVDTMRQTVRLCREGKEERLPDVLEQKLTGMLRDRWDKKFGRS